MTLDNLGEIRGLVYGKVTPTFLKKSARKYESWLCFSIILANRPFDFMASEKSIDAWVIGLCHLIKVHNPSAVVLTPGQYYWRKLKYVLVELIHLKMPSAKKYDLSFARALNLYSKLNYIVNKGLM